MGKNISFRLVKSIQLSKHLMAFIMIILLAACGGGSSSSGGSSTDELVVQVPNPMPSEPIEDGNGVVINPSCTITNIGLTPSGGTISRNSTSLRALVSFDYVATSDDARQINNVYSRILSADGNDYIFSDQLIASNVSLSNGKGQAFLSYNLQDAYSAAPDQYTEVRVSISANSFSCEAFKAVNFILTR